jgi:hypothetical protein
MINTEEKQNLLLNEESGIFFPAKPVGYFSVSLENRLSFSTVWINHYLFDIKTY